MINDTASYIYPVILSGGSGSRLWPKSRKAYPKQLHKLYGDFTMLQHTCNRVRDFNAPIVVCNEAQRFMVADQLSAVCDEKPTIVLEPVGRNTAPAIAIAALYAIKQNERAILVVLPADHRIGDQEAFSKSLDKAIACAEENKLVAFGVVPSHPETGYGYIHSSVENENGARINKFVEKPDEETAKSYVESGDFFWNSGMFVFSAQAYLDELQKYAPDIIASCKKSLELAQIDLDFIRLDESSFLKSKNVSIDYALMEHTTASWCVPLDCGWSDLGSWQSLWENSEKDDKQNASFGDVFTSGCKNSLFHSERKLIAAVGLDGVAVIDTADATLVVDLQETQAVKKVVDWLESENRSEFQLHREVHRPWGSYDAIDHGSRFQVKRIEVKPGASLSLQMHHHRAEHWIVVSGTALVQRGEEDVMLSENQSIYIPLGEKHRLTNPGKVALQLIEVQSGTYLGEDDIVRFEDTFGRT